MCAAQGMPYHSRFEVLTDGEWACAADAKGTLYRFDGLFFSRRRRRDASFALVPSWQTPSYGWLHPAECPCAVWISAPPTPLPTMAPAYSRGWAA